MDNWKFIFCEGKVDLIFLADMIEIFYSLKYEKEKKGERITIVFPEKRIKIIEMGGLSNLQNEIYYSQIQDNTKLNGKNIIFFDADYEDKQNGNNGFVNCNKKLDIFKRNKELNFEHYIWPNHKDDGDIEDLLVKLIPQDKQCIFDCIQTHQHCIKGTGLENVRFTFELKNLLGYYIYTCNEDSKNEMRDYKKNHIWNIDCENIIELKGLKNFLDIHLQIENHPIEK
ncbi:MAG: hypothetical protein KF704_05960 [Crocinitomicaceae bacterium]|nr:hypothetical protein [Crocinitomicaceae bacterium]